MKQTITINGYEIPYTKNLVLEDALNTYDKLRNNVVRSLGGEKIFQGETYCDAQLTAHIMRMVGLYDDKNNLLHSTKAQGVFEPGKNYILRSKK